MNESSRDALDRLDREVAELRASRERLVLAADADRRRIERDLHDGVQQHLVALAVNLQLVEQLVGDDPAAAKRLLQDLRRDVQQALEETAQLAQTIHPPLLETGGLAATLRAAASSIGVPSSVEVAADPGWPPEVAMTVYLCWLEALNCATEGARMTIEVREADDALSFEIGGCEQLPDRLRDRVEALGGELASSNGRVAGSIPL
jgi:signal transduction histidine kinase